MHHQNTKALLAIIGRCFWASDTTVGGGHQALLMQRYASQQGRMHNHKVAHITQVCLCTCVGVNLAKSAFSCTTIEICDCPSDTVRLLNQNNRNCNFLIKSWDILSFESCVWELQKTLKRTTTNQHQLSCCLKSRVEAPQLGSQIQVIPMLVICSNQPPVWFRDINQASLQQITLLCLLYFYQKYKSVGRLLLSITFNQSELLVALQFSAL